MARYSVSEFLSDTARRQAILRRIEYWTEVPLLCLAFIMVPLIIGPFFWVSSPSEVIVFSVLNVLIWATFASVLAVKIIVAPDKRAFLKSNWLEVLIVIVPFARPLQLFRLFLFGSHLLRSLNRLTQPDFLIVYGVGLIIMAATTWAIVEIGESPYIHTFTDSLWLAFVTITTVGYGDAFPVTPTGRIVALILMVGGIGIFGALAARLASLFVRGEDSSEIGLLLDEVRGLRKEITELREQLNQPTAR